MGLTGSLSAPLMPYILYMVQMPTRRSLIGMTQWLSTWKCPAHSTPPTNHSMRASDVFFPKRFPSVWFMCTRTGSSVSWKRFLRRYESPPLTPMENGPLLRTCHESSCCWTFYSMGEFCFGETFDSLNDPTKAEISERSFEGFRGLNAVCISTPPSSSLIFKLYITENPLMGRSDTCLCYLGSRWGWWRLGPRLLWRNTNHTRSLLRWDVLKLSQRLIAKEKLRCVFDILYATSEKPGAEGFSLPELQSESSLLVTTGQSTSLCCPHRRVTFVGTDTTATSRPFYSIFSTILTFWPFWPTRSGRNSQTSRTFVWVKGSITVNTSLPALTKAYAFLQW